jgi:D-alanyl-lipoteichoic acid acyltransferase DltB (MBOAT superfamily)
VLFNTSQYAIFFAIAFIGSWSLARREGALVRAAFLVLLGAYVALGYRYLGATWRLGDVALIVGFAAALFVGRSSWPLARISFLLVLSYYFYASWDWRYLPLIFGSSTVDFFLARAIAAEEKPSRRRAMLVATVALNLGFLGFFKYWNFGVENVRLLLAWLHGAPPLTPSSTFEVLLPPVGISFFTFESMSYVIDVYRRELPAYKSYVRYLLFVSFFPHLVAGPIVRPRDLLPQLEKPAALTRAMGGEALFLIAIGLLKKVVISDQLAANLVDRVFERPENFSALEVLAGVYGYAVQIYCDFSGYSDIAIGSALLLGVRFPPNFDSPYQAPNLADFWRRWHISLSSWLRDYLYIPLGGNRGSEWKTYRNLMITMVLGGLWHGASWNFVIWGFLHGLGLAVTRIVQRYRSRRASTSSPKGGDYRTKAPVDDEATKAPVPVFSWARLIAVIATFHYVCFAWIFFRAPTFARASLVLRQLTTLTTFHPNLPRLVLLALGVGLIAHFTPRTVYERARTRFTRLPAPVQGVLLFGVAIVLHEISSTAAVPFVYFQF